MMMPASSNAAPDANCSLKGPLDGDEDISVPVRNYDVFLNHRGPDVKKALVSHLYEALKKLLFSSFVDNREIQPGDLSWATIKSAIHHSKIHIAVFSPRYAESEWCLEELRHFMECFHKKSSALFLPVFYNLTPTDLRLQTQSCYNSAFEKHCSKFEATSINNWKRDLDAASRVSGYVFPDAFQGDEGLLVESIVSKVIEVLSRATFLHGPDHPVGVNEKLRKALDLMERKNSGRGVQKLGIYGMGGLGKTTLAKSIYNRRHREFESACFILSVSDGSKDVSMGLKGLQKDMLEELLNTKEISVRNTAHGRQMMSDRLEGKKVLIILDDVSEREQLCELMPPHDCHLGEGSQIVITTRDEQVLIWAQVQTRLPMEGLSRPLAFELFKLHAFELPEELNKPQKEPSGDFKKLAEKMVDTCQGLPLALEVLGSYLRGKHISEWEATVTVLETRIKLVDPQREVTTILKRSFDALVSKEQKEMFLDIACFLFQEPKDKGMRIWRAEYGDADSDLNLTNLIRKCLVKLGKNGELTMHDLLRDMGREIVDHRHEDYWERSHLWREADVCNVLETRNGTPHVRGLSSNVQKGWETASFTGMKELKLLVLSNVTLTGDFSLLPKKLRWFQLRYCLAPLPLNEICLDKVAVLDLEGSNFTSFDCAHYRLQNLKEINLRNCSNFKELPVDFCKSANSLEILILSGCVNLERVPDSVSELRSSLRHLDISGCSKLTALPNGITNLSALTILLMNNCGGLTNLPGAIRKITALEKIGLDRVPLSTLPLSFGFLRHLVSLRLDHSRKLRELPSTIGNLTSLTSLDIISCPLISEIPPGVTKLARLVHFQVSDCESVSQLPESIGNLWNLLELHLHDNVKLSSLPSGISELRCLRILNLQGCPNLCKVPYLPTSLTSLDVGGCTSLEELDLSMCENLKPNGIESLRSLQKITLLGVSTGRFPQSMGSLSNLISIRLHNCSNLNGLPSTIGNLKKLTNLTIISCPLISEIPYLPATLIFLDMGGCSNLERIPVSCLSSLTNLRTLDLCDCIQLVELNGLECLGLLSRLDIRGCRSLVDLPIGQLEKLTSLRELYLGGSGVSIVQDNGSSWIQKMVSLEVVSMMGDDVPDYFRESEGVECLQIEAGSRRSMKIVVPEGDYIACRGVLCCFVSTRYDHSCMQERFRPRPLMVQSKRRKLTQRLFQLDRCDFDSEVQLGIYRASHPFVGSLKGGDEMCVQVSGIGWSAVVVVKLMYGENEMEETLQTLSLFNKQRQMRRRENDTLQTLPLIREQRQTSKRQRISQRRSKTVLPQLPCAPYIECSIEKWARDES